MKPSLFDVVELLVNLPERGLSAGQRGAVVAVYKDEQYEIELTNAAGETLALATLPSDRFLVVWRAETQAWVPLAEQLNALVAHLSEETRREVLDFARFVYGRRQNTPA